MLRDDSYFEDWAVSLWRNNGPRCCEVKAELKRAYISGYSDCEFDHVFSKLIESEESGNDYDK